MHKLKLSGGIPAMACLQDLEGATFGLTLPCDINLNAGLHFVLTASLMTNCKKRSEASSTDPHVRRHLKLKHFSRVINRRDLEGLSSIEVVLAAPSDAAFGKMLASASSCVFHFLLQFKGCVSLNAEGYSSHVPIVPSVTIGDEDILEGCIYKDHPRNKLDHNLFARVHIPRTLLELEPELVLPHMRQMEDKKGKKSVSSQSVPPLEQRDPLRSGCPRLVLTLCNGHKIPITEVFSRNKDDLVAIEKVSMADLLRKTSSNQLFRNTWLKVRQ